GPAPFTIAILRLDAVAFGLALEEDFQPGDVPLLVGRHVGGEGAHFFVARVLDHVFVKALRASLESEGHRQRLARIARTRFLLRALREVPAELPAGKRRKLARRGAERHELVLLALFVTEPRELV